MMCFSLSNAAVIDNNTIITPFDPHPISSHNGSNLTTLLKFSTHVRFSCWSTPSHQLSSLTHAQPPGEWWQAILVSARALRLGLIKEISSSKWCSTCIEIKSTRNRKQRLHVENKDDKDLQGVRFDFHCSTSKRRLRPAYSMLFLGIQCGKERVEETHCCQRF